MFENNDDHSSGYFEYAQICLNGHMITDQYQTSPELRKIFCPQCGAKTICQCPNCNASIQGFHHTPGVIVLSYKPHVPAFCFNCGTPFPWTESRLQAARELTLETDALRQDSQILIDSLPDLVSDTPKTSQAVTRWKAALGKLGEHTATAFREILVQVISETTKKLLFP